MTTQSAPCREENTISDPVKEDNHQDGPENPADQEAEPFPGIGGRGAAKERGAKAGGKETARDKAADGNGHLLQKDSEESAGDAKGKRNQRE